MEVQRRRLLDSMRGDISETGQSEEEVYITNELH